MTRARNYWVATTKPSGAPHVMPVWGVWVDDAFYFGTGRESVKGRNLRRDARASVHLESGDEAVIMEGTLVEVTDAKALRRYSDACEAKYAFQPVPPAAEAPPDLAESEDVTYVLVPQVVFAWAEHNFPESATRWVRET
jgi:nitroimidazol reductase NimA-like FMN-containing flavoprotein (pyridoxamine 5'-phosphate oxidase superfamily)